MATKVSISIFIEKDSYVLFIDREEETIAYEKIIYVLK
ncbi:hypothetical protein HMPREF1127_1238 [Fusobacterium necrophorum subsp. funduliforme Fnf 1007]|uniref:Uncharacterized protein n=2 Tax=Fusobacterium necrophorum subsp. funduliforme TaxID=143387 RepID=A0AAN3VVP7_9FUSO|nr:hypothetical protein HMPREF9466_00427 [Fusobacterium necrophorum subsp. funduliforme 1_1_36S]EJU17572.1 hypothetical protein HMPREF1127_1238 [Fusobacterium necrophorum subsp. funduliforme Fnf 1007]KID48544.1 hypothetical protein C095_09725 [Fusobacterium necrophorum subsp. funduliforme B35]